LLTDLKNIFYEFGTLFHCFNDGSLDYHIVRAQNFFPLARRPTHARRRALHQLRYQLHSVEGRAKCSTVPQLCELVIGTRVAGQDSK